MTIINISRKLSPTLAVWPGDDAFQLASKASMKAGDIVNATRLNMSAHTGTHVDAPYHFKDDGITMEAVDLRPFWGRAQVVTVTKSGGALYPSDFAGYDLTLAPRLLVRSPLQNVPHDQFPDQIVYPSPELADYLQSVGIILYGGDSPSMDAVEGDGRLPGHNAIFRNKIAILEGADLSGAADGIYELVALPLNILGGDGSPVRAALKTIEGE